jgi:hypothetical protein
MSVPSAPDGSRQPSDETVGRAEVLRAGIDVPAPSETTPVVRRRRFRLRGAGWAGALVALTALEWLHMPAGTRNAFWAEDGHVFLGQWLNDPHWWTFFRPYAGYLHVVPRIGGWLATLFPPPLWAIVINLFACAVVAAVCLLVFAVCGSVVRSLPARIGLGLLPLLTPITRVEAVGSVANLHWYALYLIPWLLLARPRSRRCASGLAVVAALAALTEPQVVIWLPLVVVVLWRDRRWEVAAGWAVGAGAQTLTVLLAPSQRASDFHDVGSAFLGWTLTAVTGNALPGGGWLMDLLRHTGWAGPIAGAGVLVGLAALTWWRGTTRHRIAVLSVVLGSITAWCAAFFLNRHPGFVFATMTFDAPTVRIVRWATGAALLAMAVIPLCADALARHGEAERLLGVVGVGLMLLVMAFWFTRADSLRTGRVWPAGLAWARAHCADGHPPVVAAPQNPGGWELTVPCARLR